MENRDRQSLKEMLKALRRLRDYTQGTSRETLAAEPMRLDAVMYEIVLLGEAAQRLTPKVRTAHPGVPWRETVAMRSAVTHNYERVNNDALWEVIESDLPDLMAKLEAILS